MPQLVLASSSPRRRDLLARLGVEPARIAFPDIDESPLKAELPRVYAMRMAIEKAPRSSRVGRDCAGGGHHCCSRAADLAARS
jgi:septum formation protein